MLRKIWIRRAANRNRRRSRALKRQAAAGGLGRAPTPDRGGWRGLAGRGRRQARAGASRVLIYFHGGGYCSGSIVSHRRLVTEAGRAGGLRTLAPAYRLAPEHPFPAARDDALTVWRRLRRDGYAARQIAVGGDSAGANLTLALVGELNRVGEDLPGCLWLLSPWVDLTMSGATLKRQSGADPLIQKGYLEELAKAYVPGDMDRSDPRLSPLYADLKGLPPTLIQIGSAETLLDDAVRFA